MSEATVTSPVTNLSPGFRFHPTDEELVCYFLKRKVCNKKFQLDVIAEIDIYKFEPWDLPGLITLFFPFCFTSCCCERGANVNHRKWRWFPKEVIFHCLALNFSGFFVLQGESIFWGFLWKEDSDPRGRKPFSTEKIFSGNWKPQSGITMKIICGGNSWVSCSCVHVSQT